MNKVYLKVGVHDVIGKLQEHAAKLVRGNEQSGWTPKSHASFVETIYIGDAKKVIEKFYREKAKAAAPARLTKYARVLMASRRAKTLSVGVSLMHPGRSTLPVATDIDFSNS